MLATQKQALKFLAAHLFYGLAAGISFGGAVLMTDLGHLRTLAMDSAHPVLVLTLFFFGLCVTFGSVGMGVGVMSLGNDDEREMD